MLLTAGGVWEAHAQVGAVQEVVVFHRGSDALGTQISQQVREGLNTAPDFTLNKDANLLIIIHTQGVSQKTAASTSGTENSVSVVNVIWTLREGASDQFPSYLESTLGYVGKDRLEQISSGIVSDSRQIVTNIIPRAQQGK